MLIPKAKLVDISHEEKVLSHRKVVQELGKDNLQ